jgi:hypothetical protein
MNVILRRIAVSGSATVALLGGAAAITTATAPAASAAEVQTVAHESVTAPVNLPDGRTMRITGMGGYGNQASAGHVTAVTAVAYKTSDTPAWTDSVGTDPTTNGGSGSGLQNPYNNGQVPAGYNQQITTQASGGVIGVGIVAVIVLGVVVFFRVKHSHLKVGDAVVVGLLGVALSGTVIGAMATQITNSGVGSLGGVISGL